MGASGAEKTSLAIFTRINSIYNINVQWPACLPVPNINLEHMLKTKSHHPDFLDNIHGP